MRKVLSFDLNKNYLRKFGTIELGLGALGFASSSFLPLPPFVALGTGLLAAGMGGWHLCEWFETRKKKESLNDGNVWSTNSFALAEYRKSQGAGPDDLLLGKGFTFTRKHLAYYEQIKNDITFKADTSHRNKEGGKHYIHNLGKDEEEPKIFNCKEHTIIAGEPGSGKSVLLDGIINQLIMDGEAVVIFDMKGDMDLINGVRQSCCDASRPYDFNMLSLAHPKKSFTFDPLTNALKSSDGANRITSIMGMSKDGKSFQDFCWNVLNIIGEAILYAGLKLNIANYHKYSLLKMDELLHQARIIVNETDDQNQRQALRHSIERLELLSEHPYEHYSKMITSLEPILSALAVGEVGALLSPDKPDLTWEDIVKSKKVVYFYIPSMIDDHTSSATGKLLLQDMISYLGQVNAYENKKHRLKLICDEFYSLVFKNFSDLINKGRGAGLQVFLGMQTSSDIEAQLDRALAEVFLGSLINTIYLRISEKNLAQKYCDKLPEVEYDTIQDMQSVSATPTSGATLHNTSTNRRLQTTQQTLVTPEMIMGLPMGQAFVYNKGMDPTKITIPLVKKQNTFKYFQEVLNKEFSLKGNEYLADIDYMMANHHI